MNSPKLPPRVTPKNVHKLLPRPMRKTLGTRTAFWWEGFFIGSLVTILGFYLSAIFHT